MGSHIGQCSVFDVAVRVAGASAAAGAFNEDFIREMTTLNDRPVIFALSNPTSKAECTAEQAYTFSEVRVRVS